MPNHEDDCLDCHWYFYRLKRFYEEVTRLELFMRDGRDSAKLREDMAKLRDKIEDIECAIQACRGH